MMRYRFIKAEKAKDNIGRLCNLLKVSRAGFYAWANRKPSQRQRDDMVLLAHIRSQFEASLRSYGRPRMVKELRELCFTIGHTRIGRLMRVIRPPKTGPIYVRVFRTFIWLSKGVGKHESDQVYRFTEGVYFATK